MKISTIKTSYNYLYRHKLPNNQTEDKAKAQVEKKYPYVDGRLFFVSFYGDKSIKPAKRLNSSDYKISSYINEISKARYLHGNKAIVDMSMGNPDLTPPEKAKIALKDKVNDLWSHRYNAPKGDGYVRIVMSANEKQINDAFKRIEKAGIRFDISKLDLPERLQSEIKSMADGTYNVKPKEDRDFDDYLKILPQRRALLLERLKGKDIKFNKFLPLENPKLPWNILKDGQSVYLQNVKDGCSEFGTIKDILPFSDKEEYSELCNDIRAQWKQSKYPNAEILPPYKSLKTYDDAAYFVLRTDDNKIQALANLEIQDDGTAWGRSLNTAPWNQGKERIYKNSAKAVIARMVSFCMETGNYTLKFATDKPYNIALYKSLGMKEEGERYFNGVKNVVLSFDKAAMEKFLSVYQVNLAF